MRADGRGAHDVQCQQCECSHTRQHTHDKLISEQQRLVTLCEATWTWAALHKQLLHAWYQFVILTGQPTAMAGDTLRVIMDMGKFQGVMAATTPTGCLMITGRLLPDTVCRTSPVTLRHSSANHSIEAALQTHTCCETCLQYCSALML